MSLVVADMGTCEKNFAEKAGGNRNLAPSRVQPYNTLRETAERDRFSAILISQDRVSGFSST
jgi:hypothetical protein